MIIHPSDGFDDWRSFLIGTLEPGGEYSSFLKDTNILINEIIDYNSLLSPNANFTESFLSETLVELINKIMNFTNIQQTEKTNIVKFIKNAQVLIPWAALNDRIDLFDPFTKLIDAKTPFFKSISKGKEIQELSEYFVNHEFLTLISLRISKNKELPITYDHMNLFFKLMNNFPKMADTAQINLLLTVTPVFAEMLKNFDKNINFQSFHINKFLETLQIFIKFTEIILGESSNEILTTSLDIGFSLLKMDVFDKQNLGASILTLFSSSKEKMVKETFFKFMKNKNFVADLMERDLHSEVLDTILPVFKFLISSKQMNQNDLVQILHATTKVSFDQQETFYNLIFDAIKPLNPKDTISFFNKILPIPNQKGENESEIKAQFDSYSIVFLKFSVLTLMKLKNCSYDLVSVIINQIVEIASIHPNQNEAIEIVQQLCEKNVPEEIKYPLLKSCKSKFEKNYSPFLISILTQLFNLNKSKNYSIDFNDDFFTVLQKHLFSTNDKSFLYELFAKLLHSQHKKITNDMMNSILNDSKSDMLWNFLSQVIDNDDKNAFEEDSFVTLKKFVENYTEINSRFFLEFLHRIMIIVNLEAKNLKVKTISTSSTKGKTIEKMKMILIKTPLIFEQKLINAIDDQGTLFKTVKSILLNLLKNSEPESLSITHLLYLLNEKEKMINLKEQNGRFQIYQFLRIIKSFCKNYGKTDKNRIIPHGLKISTEKQFYIARFKVNVSDESDKFSFNLDIQSDVAIAFLVSLISPNLLYPLDRYKIILDGKEIFSSSKVKYLKNDQIINITLLEQPIEDYSNDPTYILSKKGFSSKLLKFFDDIQIKKTFEQENDQQQKINNKYIKLLSSLLDMLPTDEKLLVSSSDPKKFLHSLSKCKNPYQLQYMIQVLNWRLFSNKYLELYKKENILLNTLIKMCNKNSNSFSKSADEFLSLFKKLNCLKSNESVVPLMQIISLKDLDNINKKEYILYLIKMKTNISDVFSNNPELLGDVIENINENNFETLWPYISNVKEFNPIYDMVLSRLQKQTSNNIQFFTKIFFHYLSRTTTNDIEKQLNSCIQLLIDSTMATAQSPIGIVSAMKQLVDNNTAKLASASGFINKLFVLINSGYPKDAQKMLYDICCSLSDISQENKVALISFIDSVSSLKIEKWNILIDEDRSNSIDAKHKGLRNLGSTCYMNSVLQQFYSIYAFDFLLANSKKEDKETKDQTEQKSKKEKEEDHSFYFLQKLFCSLSMTKRSSCDTKQFFDTWSQTHTHALPSEQHDATEFMQYFLGDMPKCIESLYTGKITNFIESEDHSFKTQIDEPFISIPISIDKYKSVEESLSSILNPQKLFGNNQYTKPDGVKVNAESYQKIKVSPPVLIIQLARFKFNQTTKMREKINSRFEIADEINLSNILIQNKEDTKNNYSSYKLNGVVVHRGDGNHGHYISYIKNSDYNPDDDFNTEKRWLRFDDMDVTEVDQTAFENEAFGSNLPQQSQFSNELNNMSGYLLFYIANGSSVNFITDKSQSKSTKKSKSKSKSKQETNQDQKQIITIPVLSENRIEFPKEITKEISHDNEIYLNEKSAFTTPTFEFILEEANPTQLCDFFFKVFCHSSSKGKIVSTFEEKINNIISTDTENTELIDWLTKNVTSIIPIFINCNSSDIINSVNNIITKSISTLSVEKGGKLVSMFVIYLHSCLEAWRQVFNISNIILTYLKIRKENIEYAIKNNWPDSLVKFVTETYNGERQEYFLQNINISPVFDSLDILLRENLKEVFQPLLSIHQQIQKSPSLKNYRNLIVHCASIEIFPIEDVVSIFPNELKDSNIMEIKFGKMNEQTNLETINNSLKAANISQNKIIDYIYENRKKFKNYFIMKQNMNYLYNLFLVNSNKIESIITENLANENNQEILQPFFDFIRSKMEEISKKENQNVILSYLRIILFLMKKTNYPHDKNLEELNFFTKYQNKSEFIQISSYVGNPIILSIYDQKFPQKEEKKVTNLQVLKDFFTIKSPSTIANQNKDKQINDNFPSNEFFNIVRTILSSSDKVVDQFINKPNICDVISKSVSTIKNESDIELMVKFIEFLKKKQNKYQILIPRILYAIISGNDQNLNYIISISKYFNEIMNDLNFKEIANMLRIVDAILKNGSNEQNDKALQFFAPSIFSYLENQKISFSDADTSLLTMNSEYISKYMSENSSVINIMVHLVTKIACLNVNFRKDSEKTFQRYLYYANNSDGTGYHCATILVYYCFNDSTKKENDVVKYLTEMCKFLARIHNDKWRNIFYKALINFAYNDSTSIPNWAKLLVNETFKFATLSCENEKFFFKIVFKGMNNKEFPAFLMNYSKSFSSDIYKLSWLLPDKKMKAISQLDQLVFLMNEFPDEKNTIIQFLDIKKEWFKIPDLQQYKKLILPNEK